MCEGCWREYLNDMPAGPVVTDKVRYVLPLLLDADPFGPLHIVVEDWNLGDDHVAYCAAEAKGSSDERLQGLLVDMTVAERAVAMALCDGYLELTP